MAKATSKPTPASPAASTGPSTFRVTLRSHSGHWDIQAATAADAIESVRKQTGKLRHPSQFRAVPITPAGKPVNDSSSPPGEAGPDDSQPAAE